ncbi:MAG: hypothetical protein OXU21_14135 [Chloroflexota bacterium]|nr:hypothetical protein [Chloroflexota bacterium]
MARAGGTGRVPARRENDRDRTSALAARLAREPQIAALEAVTAWAETQGVSPKSVDGMRKVIAVFAADPEAPNLDLAMRARRRRIVREFRETDQRG